MFIMINCKKKIILYIIIILLISSFIYYFYNLPSIPSSTENMEFRVVIDPGHGSIDTGTHYKNIYEKNINLSIAMYLKEEFKKVNIIPIMTRKEDKLFHDDRNEDLKHRPKIAEKYNADLYISLHVNNFSTKYPCGSQIFYKPNSDKSQLLAEKIQEKLIKLRPENNREILNGNFYVLNKVPCPAVLIESGFLSNPADRKKLTDINYQKKFAAAVKEGTVTYLQRQINNFNINIKNIPEKYSSSYSCMKVYFLNSINTRLLLKEQNFIYPVGSFLTSDYHQLNNKEIIALAALKQLISPPEDYTSLFPATTKINYIDYKEKTLTVNFSKNIKTDFTGGAGLELMAVKSIKNTLFSIPGIEEITILIDGKKKQSIAGHIILNKFIK